MAVSPRSTSVGLAGLTSLGDSWVAPEPRLLGPHRRGVRPQRHAGECPAVEQGPGGGGAAARAADVPVPLAGWLAQTMAARVEAHAHA
jgi:3-hydroxyisobutyrate dehydrogenase